MKMNAMKMLLMTMGITFAGCMYFKYKPEVFEKMKNKMRDMGKDVSRQMYNKLDSEM